jgi:hypothetical protein
MQEQQIIDPEDAQAEAPAQESEGEVEDWKAKFEVEAVARQASDDVLTKERLDWKSQKNELLIKKNLEDMVTQIAEKLQVDASSIEEPVRAVMQSSEQARSQTTQVDAADALATEVRAIAKTGGIEMIGEDAKRATRIWKHGQTLWEQGNVGGAMREFEEAKEEMKDTVERVKRRNEREAEKEEQASEQRDLVDAGAADLSGPRGTGAASVKSWKAAQKINKVGDLSDDDYAKLIAG